MDIEPRWRRIRPTAHQTLYGTTERISCSDGSALIFGSGTTGAGSSADARGLLHDHEDVRVLVDGTRIVGVSHANPSIHPVTEAIMAAHGMDVDAIRAWACSALVWAREARHALEPPEMGVVIGDDDQIHMTCAFSDYAVTHEHLTIQQKMPESITTACQGRLLREIVSIPELDHIDIPIVHAERTPLGTQFTILPEHGATPLA